MSKGTVFWRKDEDGPNRHLRFVISDSDVDGMVLVVHMTKYYRGKLQDSSCLLHPGDHPCIKHESHIRYDQAFEKKMVDFVRERIAGDITVKPKLTESILQRIQEGARRSPALARKFKKFFSSF